MLDVKKDFPILKKNIVYLDSAATSQKPLQVINAVSNYYRYTNANIHRGIYKLAQRSSRLIDSARAQIAKFIGADPGEIIFVRGTTEAVNFIASRLSPKIVTLSVLEHHSNLVPWHILASERSIQLEFIPVSSEGLLDLEEYQRLLRLEPRLVAFCHMSNVLGTVNPAKEIIKRAHEVGAVTLVDGAQSVPHLPVDVQDLDADFLAFSGHKMCGPTGIGILYGRKELLQAMPPFLGGGDMIKRVYLRSFRPNDLPYKFEAGTPAIVEAVGLGAAAGYLQSMDMDLIHQHEREIISYTLERLEEIPGVKVFGPDAQAKGGVASFVLNGVHAHDVAQILDQYGIAVRAGHHCAMPLHDKFGVPATARASFYLYNTIEDVDKLVEGIYKVKQVFKN